MVGSCVVVLDGPKSPENVGTVLRSALALGAQTILVCSPRWPLARHPLHRLKTDPNRAARHLDVRVAESLADGLGRPELAHHEIVAVELGLVAPVYLDEFRHPEKCCYVFGPEDGSVGTAKLGIVARHVEIRGAHDAADPHHRCLNLATAVSVTLFDRAAKTLNKT